MGKSLACVLVGLTSVGTAEAASFRHQDTHTTSKAPAEAWRIMTAYSETCDSGCKYHRPSLVKVLKLNHRASSSRWYTWSHISSTVKDAKYFTEVSVTFKSDGSFVSNNRQLGKSDKELVETLEEKTGLKHSPVFDGGTTHTVAERKGNHTVLTQVITVETGALVGIWAGRIRDEMKKAVDATFANIGK